MELDKHRTGIVLFLGVIAVSFAAIFIRMSTAPPLVISFYRMAIATVALVPYITKNLVTTDREQFFDLRPWDWSLIVIAGLLLSIHFALWVTSLNHTSVASSVILVTTQPVFIVLFEAFILNTATSKRLMMGIAVAAVGGVLIGYGDLTGARFALVGDLLALGGAIMAAGYFLAGREVRQRLDNVPYIFLVYGISSVFLLIFCWSKGLPMFDYSPRNFLLFVLLAIIPTLIGHSSFNWALKEVKASRVGTTILGEPIGASLLAVIFFHEIPPLISMIGGIIVLYGIYYVWKTRDNPEGGE